MKGRKPIPTTVKQAKGTLQPCRTNPNEPNYVLLQQIPDPPDFLTEYGRKIYYETAEELLKVNVLSRISFAIFVMYCEEVAIYFEARRLMHNTKLIYKDGGGNPKANPYHRIANDALSASVRIATEFGITPASQSKVNAIPTGESSKEALVKRLNRFNK